MYSDSENIKDFHITLNDKVKIKKEKLGTVIFNIEAEKVFVANSTGEDILNLLLNGKSVYETIDTLTKKYDKDSNEISSDVFQFLEEFFEKQIISKK